MELEMGDEAAEKEFDEFSEATTIERDLPPEYCHYKDEGCDLAGSCLNCPFTKCVYDEPGGKQRWLKELRTKEMVKLYTSDGKGVKELAQMFSVSQRTVQRALKSARVSIKRGRNNG